MELSRQRHAGIYGTKVEAGIHSEPDDLVGTVCSRRGCHGVLYEIVLLWGKGRGNRRGDELFPKLGKVSGEYVAWTLHTVFRAQSRVRSDCDCVCGLWDK